MSRTPNDDRSDTMNPNNDAYWADQDNRYGSPDDDSSDNAPAAPAKGESATHPLDAVADPNLGPRARYRRIDLVELRWRMEDVFATAESEERDKTAAVAELLRMAERVLHVALDAATRQKVPAQLLTGDDSVELLVNDGRHLRVSPR